MWPVYVRLKGHEKELAWCITCHTCRLWLIAFAYASLVIPIPQIELGEVSYISKLIEQVIDAKNEIFFLDGESWVPDSRRIVEEIHHASFGITPTHHIVTWMDECSRHQITPLLVLLAPRALKVPCGEGQMRVGLAPDSNAMALLAFLLGGNLLGNSVGMTSLDSSSIFWMTLGAWPSLPSSSSLSMARKVSSFFLISSENWRADSFFPSSISLLIGTTQDCPFSIMHIVFV